LFEVLAAGAAPAGDGLGASATAPGVPGGDVAGELSGGPEPAPVTADEVVSRERFALSARPTLETTTMTRRTISNTSSAVAPEALR
jgi:hypothetical protein